MQYPSLPLFIYRPICLYLYLSKILYFSELQGRREQYGTERFHPMRLGERAQYMWCVATLCSVASSGVVTFHVSWRWVASHHWRIVKPWSEAKERKVKWSEATRYMRWVQCSAIQWLTIDRSNEERRGRIRGNETVHLVVSERLRQTYLGVKVFISSTAHTAEYDWTQHSRAQCNPEQLELEVEVLITITVQL